MRFVLRCLPLLVLLVTASAFAEEWKRFRGEGGSGVSNEKNLPVKWSETENIIWRTKMPGAGTSSPIIVGNKIYLTSYSGYGQSRDETGEMSDLLYHILCVDRKSGKILFDKTIKPNLPEQSYRGYMLRHGYTSSTPASDGKHVYFFLGKTGVFCYDLGGKQIWHKSIGTRTDGWGSATSPLLYKNLLILNASVESGALVALNKKTGEEVWKTPGISSSWSTPILVNVPSGQTELVVSGSKKILGFDPDTGKRLWHADSYNWYVCPSVVAHDGVVYGLQNSTCVAVKAGGRGDVTKTHTLWQKSFGSTVPSPVYYKGHVYFANNATIYCLGAAEGNVVYRKGLTPRSGTIYASPLVADGKIYFVSQSKGTYVLKAGPEFEQQAHNAFKDDNSRTNASPIADDGCLIMRTDRYLYCIGKK